MQKKDEENFPRGGSLVTERKRKASRDGATDLFKSYIRTGVKTKKTKFSWQAKSLVKKKKKKKKQDGIEQFQSNIDHMGVLTSMSVTHGMLLLGSIRAINDYHLIVSLPNGLEGKIQITNISDAYTAILQQLANAGDNLQQEVHSLQELFHVGMQVRCKVIDVTSGGKKYQRKIGLSINPKDVNQALQTSNLKNDIVLSGCVSSVEDHGYVIDIGLKNVHAFLKMEEAQMFIDEYNEGNHLYVGSYIHCMVSDDDRMERLTGESRAINVVINPRKVYRTVATENMGITISTLLPGTTVMATISMIRDEGLIVKFLGYTGSIHRTHLEVSPSELDKQQEVKACILYVHPNTKAVVLTTLSHLITPDLAPKKLFGDLTVGNFIKKAKVLHIDNYRGVYFKVTDQVIALARKTNLSDKDLKDIHTAFKKGSLHKCRVIGFDYVDRNVLVTLRQSVLEQQFMTYADLQPGSLVEATVKEVKEKGIKVLVTKQIEGFIPRLHLVDVPLRHPEQRFTESDKIKCRVVKVNPAEHRLLLTCKKSLVNSKFPIITSYDQLEKGMQLEGVIVSIQSKGLVVIFYNDVKGLVPKSQMSTEYIEYPEKVFFEGQIVQCQVLFSDMANQRCVLTLKITNKTPFGSKAIKLPDGYKIGKCVNARIVKKTDKGFDLELLPSKLPAFLPVAHLSDHSSNCAILHSFYKEGQVITKVMYIGKRNIITVTMKPTLIKAAKSNQLALSFDDIKPGLLLCGAVSKIVDYGIFIDLLDELTGLVPKRHVCDCRVQDLSLLYQEGQTVIVKVKEVDAEKKQLVLSLKMADCYAGNTDIGLDLLEQYFVEYKKVMTSYKKEKGSKAKLSSLNVGKRVNCLVTEVNRFGVICELENKIQGFVTVEHMPGVCCEPGSNQEGVILYLDPESTCVELSFDKELIKVVQNLNDNKYSQVRQGQVIKSVTHLIKDDFVLVSLKGHASGRLAYLPAKKHLNDVLQKHQYCVGQVNSLVIKRVGEEVLASLNIHEPKEDGSPKKASVSEHSDTKSHNLKLGSVATARIKGVLKNQINVWIGETPGRIHISEVADSIKDGEQILKKYNKDDGIKIRVIGFRDPKSYNHVPAWSNQVHKCLPECTVKPSKVSRDGCSSEDSVQKQTFLPGQSVQAFIVGYTKYGLKMHVTPIVKGKIDFIHLSERPKVLNRYQSHFKIGQGYNCTVLQNDDGFLDLSLIGKKHVDDVEPNRTVEGLILSVNQTSGMTLQLPQGYSGNVALTDFADDYQDRPTDHYSPWSKVRCCVVKSNPKNKCVLSLRKSRLNKEKVQKSDIKDPEIVEISDLKVGTNIRGFVTNCDNNGIFVLLSSSLSGRVMYNNLSENYMIKPKKYFTPGKVVTVHVLGVDASSGHVELSMLQKHTGCTLCIPMSMIVNQRQPGLNENATEMAGRKAAKKRKIKDDGKLSELKSKKKKKIVMDDDKRLPSVEDGIPKVEKNKDIAGKKDDSGVDSDMEDKMVSNVCLHPSLSVSSGFTWDNKFVPPGLPGEKHISDTDSDSEDDRPTVNKKTKAEKKRQLQEEEKRIYQTEQQLLDEGRELQSAADFDRQILQSPDSSLVWLRYMAFHLESSEIEKARVVAERALKTISFREEQEKLNVWVAYMNLENIYGTHESLTAVFKRALQYNDPASVYSQLINIYIHSGKTEGAEELYNQMLRKFNFCKDVWMNFGLFYFKINKPNMARKLMQRSLKSLDKRDHVETLTKFAQMEFKYGEPERGKTMFENILSSYPKRTDLWLIYIEMMIKLEEHSAVRQLFERVVHLNLSAKKMKTLFKKYLEFEQKYGTEENVASVKQKAIDYVESKASI